MRIRCCDLETSGLGPGAKIIEIGAWDIVDANDAGAAEIESRGESLVNPGRSIDPEASAVHHLLAADVAKAEPFEAVWPRFRPDSDVVALAAHRADFEKSFLTPALTGDGVAWICTWRCALRLWPEAPNHQLQTLRYWLGLAVDPEIANQAHRAWPDAYVCAHLLRRMLDEASYATLVEWSSYPGLLPLCHIGKHKGKQWAEVPSDYLQWMVKQTDMAPDLVFTAKHHLNIRR